MPVLPLPKTAQLVEDARLGGEVAFAVSDAETGEILEARLPETPLPPASTLKVVTTLYALERLGPDFRFQTDVLATGPVVNGRLKGDLILAGGGDPTLDVDRLGDMASDLRKAGLIEITGRFLVWRDALPRGNRIDTEQPEQVAYNPAFGGLNLNFNRVHFEWQRSGDGYETSVQANGLRFNPATDVAEVALVDRPAPVFDYSDGHGRDLWSVAEGVLGKTGARWLPVRYPARYAGDVFCTLMRSNGIVLPKAEILDGGVPDGAVRLGVSESGPLTEVLREMLKYSTNLTAELAGLTASQSEGVPVSSLRSSALRMSGWAARRMGVRGLHLVDHSGLGSGSGMTPAAMVEILRQGGAAAPLLKPVNLSLDRKRPSPDGVTVLAKTGTLNFVSALVGFLRTKGGRDLCFAIYTADLARHDAVPPEARERPPGLQGWLRRSRQLQKELIRAWAARADA